MSLNSFDLHGVSIKEVVKRTWEEIRRDDVFGRSAQLAYYFFLALFPFLICVIASLSVFGSADRGRAVLFGLFARLLPRPAFLLISNTFNDILRTGGHLKMSLGIVITLASASMGMSAVIDTLNAAYRLKETRSVIRQYLTAIGLTLAIALLLVVSLIAVIIGDRIADARGFSDIAATAWRVAEWPITLGVLFAAFAITYHFAPDVKDREWHWITPGAVLGIVLLILMSVGFRIYLRYSQTYEETYGSLGDVIVLLLCFYLGGMAVLAGGALNGVMQNLARDKVQKSELQKENQDGIGEEPKLVRSLSQAEVANEKQAGHPG
ncbi:MAG: YihY/virulence factor BrkB family protein [Terriglobales bacterium]